MNFSWKLSLLVLLAFYLHIETSIAAEQLNCTTPNTHDECPTNAICSAVNETTTIFQCTCLPSYVWNPLWQAVISGNNANNISTITSSTNNSYSNSNSNQQFNISTSVNATAYCLNADAANATETTNGKVYIRQPKKVKHLAFGIIMVLFVVIAAISLLYLLKVLSPIKRSKAAYTKLRRRRENRERLEEFCDDISMIELHEKR